MSCAILLHYECLQKDDVRINKAGQSLERVSDVPSFKHSEQGLAGLILHFEKMYYQIGQGDRLPVESVE